MVACYQVLVGARHRELLVLHLGLGHVVVARVKILLLGGGKKKKEENVIKREKEGT